MNHGERIDLNGRTYTILDIGEGPCRILIVEDLLLWMSTIDLPTSRVLVVDASMVLTDTTCDSQRARQIAGDMHLLMDIYWLEEVTIKCEIQNLDTAFIREMMGQRTYARELLNRWCD